MPRSPLFQEREQVRVVEGRGEFEHLEPLETREPLPTEHESPGFEVLEELPTALHVVEYELSESWKLVGEENG